MGRDFNDIVAELSNFDGHEVELTGSILETIPVTGASIATLGELLGSETVSASDPQVARLDELQFDLGEGPCWDALAQMRPMLEPDVRVQPDGRWPAFSEALQTENVGAIFAFPMTVGTLRVGAVDLYNTEPGELSPRFVAQATELTAALSRYVLRRALRQAGSPDAEGTGHARRTIHQATGFVIAQLGVSAEDAYLLLQGQAFADGRSMSELATDIIEHRFRFVVDQNGIEELS